MRWSLICSVLPAVTCVLYVCAGPESASAQSCGGKPCNGVCPTGECMGPANFDEYPATGCPTNARNIDNWCCNGQTPIIIDVGGRGFSLTDLEHGVKFDLSGTGMQERVSWTAKNSGNAWLALDRNGNGKIDSGAELFGNRTMQPQPPDGQEKNGFLALAVFDRPENGGTGDGIIDRRDAVYPRLLLWQDLNRDGISQPEEVHHLYEFGITAIELHYESSRKTDSYGNVFRYRSKLYRDTDMRDDLWVYDVILLTAPLDAESNAKNRSDASSKLLQAAMLGWRSNLTRLTSSFRFEVLSRNPILCPR